MVIFPAIDLYEGKVVRLLQGDYSRMTVYSDDPVTTALSFASAGAQHLHIVDLEGARDGNTANYKSVEGIVNGSGLKFQIGGGVRDIRVIEKYAHMGAERVILGTAAITRPGFIKESVRAYGDLIAIGVDIKDDRVAIKGWTETSDRDAFEFCRELVDVGVKTIICTNISKDGALAGADTDLYRALTAEFAVNIIASGGVTTINELITLRSLGVFGVILGNALYRGRINLKEAIELVSGHSE
ncbi:MAG: 1-(5-phosphoribosyl)-5-[(5-phosphoribosylamino)methylideneamino]imidazole-4-carboxamide isomerase [Oscillospiraceae bacterium]|nr:1-(5-phosphoribosyl)-5-[(5-phosphoribosylamino)methylideneamino]imidazole-4-carboxamide isomerase [Oscillospiraceae bacterium]